MNQSTKIPALLIAIVSALLAASCSASSGKASSTSTSETAFSITTTATSTTTSEAPEATAPSTTAVVEDDVLPLVIDDATIAKWRAERPERSGYCWGNECHVGPGFHGTFNLASFGYTSTVAGGVYRGVDVNGNWVFDMGDHPASGEMIIGRFSTEFSLGFERMRGASPIGDSHPKKATGGSDSTVEYMPATEITGKLSVGTQYILEAELIPVDCDLVAEAQGLTEEARDSCKDYVSAQGRAEARAYNEALTNILQGGGNSLVPGDAGSLNTLSKPNPLLLKVENLGG